MKFPKIMGIVNVTPDSFSDGGKFFSKENAIEHSLKLLEDGADLIDIGGESTRPGAEPVELAEEIRRVIPVIEGILAQKPDAVISIDTTKYEVAKLALEAGAKMINDISGLQFEPRLAELAVKHNASFVIMHIQGVPRIMQVAPYYDDVVKEVFEFLKVQTEKARKAGVGHIICDVGIGFGKLYEHNIELLRNIDKFSELGTDIMLGVSRKSFIGKMLGIENPAERDIATAFIHSLLLSKKIDYIRVHNVSLVYQLKRIYEVIGN